MNIALVALPNPILSSPTAHFQQGILYVGNALKEAGHKVRVIDLRARTDIKSRDIPDDVDIVGVSATTGEIGWAKRVNQLAKHKHIRTMIGGAHATFVPSDCGSFDFIIVGDGEKAAVEALREMKPGVYCSPLEDLQGYFPDWELVGMKGMSRELFTGAGYKEGPLAAGAHTSRGCVFRCSYCRVGRDKVRYRVYDDIKLELEYLKHFGAGHIRFYDENMTLDRHRFFKLCEIFKAVGIKWRAHTRGDLWNDQVAEMASGSGCVEMGIGMEAASNSVLATIRKQETVEQHREAVRVCKRHGIICKAFWMVGLPGQGWNEIEDIKSFMTKERPDKWILSVFTPYPGSDVWEHPEEYRVLKIDKNFEHYWNFTEKPVIDYKDNPASEILRQYRHLKVWLERVCKR